MNSSRTSDNVGSVRTSSVEEAREILGRIYTKPTLKPANGVKLLNASFNSCQVQNVGLDCGCYGAAVYLEFPEADYFLQMFPIQGKGEIISGKTTTTLMPGSTAVVSPSAGYQANYDADYEHLVLKFDSQALTKKLALLTGVTIDEPLQFDVRQNSTRPGAQFLRDYFLFLVDKFNARTSPLPAWALAQHEQPLMTLFLCANQHSCSHLLGLKPADASQSQVRRAEEYIEANWQQPITMEDLAKVTGVSAFSLFHSFKRHRGCSPLAFASQVRSRRKGAH